MAVEVEQSLPVRAGAGVAVLSEVFEKAPESRDCSRSPLALGVMGCVSVDDASVAPTMLGS